MRHIPTLNNSLTTRRKVGIVTFIAVAGSIAFKITMQSYWLKEGVLFAPQSSYPITLFLFYDFQDFLLIGSLFGLVLLACLTFVSNPNFGLSILAAGGPACFLLWIGLSALSAGLPVPVHAIVHPKTGTTLMLVDTSGFFNNAWDIVRQEPRSRYRWRRIFTGPGDQMDLSHSEDGEFTAKPQLYVTEDGNRLFVQRGGLWTDCVNISDEPVTMCSETPLRQMVKDAWERRSREIEKMVKAAKTLAKTQETIPPRGAELKPNRLNTEPVPYPYCRSGRLNTPQRPAITPWCRQPIRR